jgi:integrase
MKQLLNDSERNENEAKLRRENALDLIKHNLINYPAIFKAIFELSFYTPLSVFQIIDLNISDVNLKKNYITLNDGNKQYILITQNCSDQIKEIISSDTRKNGPLFRNNQGQRLSLLEMWCIRRQFWLYDDN